MTYVSIILDHPACLHAVSACSTVHALTLAKVHFLLIISPYYVFVSSSPTVMLPHCLVASPCGEPPLLLLLAVPASSSELSNMFRP